MEIRTQINQLQERFNEVIIQHEHEKNLWLYSECLTDVERNKANAAMCLLGNEAIAVQKRIGELTEELTTTRLCTGKPLVMTT